MQLPSLYNFDDDPKKGEGNSEKRLT